MLDDENMTGASTHMEPKKALTAINTPLGHAVPPFTPFSVTFHVPAWANLMHLLDNPQETAKVLKSIYPRFGPWGLVKEVGTLHLYKKRRC